MLNIYLFVYINTLLRVLKELPAIHRYVTEVWVHILEIDRPGIDFLTSLKQEEKKNLILKLSLNFFKFNIRNN